MAEIQTPKPVAGPYTQSMHGGRPTAAAAVTAIAGVWAAYNGFILFMIGNYTPSFSVAMILMGLGIINTIFGLLNIFAGYGVYNHKSSGKRIGILSYIILIFVNIIIMAIGLLGMALCIISFILLAMYNS